LLRRAAKAATCRRESSVVLRLDTGTLLEAIADLAFEEADGWVVVDFKTDAGVGARAEAQYRRQVALYARGISEATAKPARGYLLGV
jgi:ATP-dependent exoDNAse (exonuclease V) beta subunit